MAIGAPNVPSGELDVKAGRARESGEPVDPCYNLRPRDGMLPRPYNKLTVGQ